MWSLDGQLIDDGGLTAAWTRLRYHPIQFAAMRCQKRFVVIPAGRGSGKTEIALRKLVMELAAPKPWPDPRYFFAAPTVTHAKDIAWERVLSLIPPHWVAGQPERGKDSLTIRTVFGSQLQLIGLNQERVRIEGRQWDGGIIDESSYVNPGVFDTKVSEALVWRTGWCWRIGVPKRNGVGATEFRAFYERGLSGTDPDIASFAWPSSDIIPQNLLDYYRRVLDPKDYAEQFEASWVTAGGRIFWAFDREQNVKRCSYQPDRPLTVTCDFNVDPMAWVLGHRYGERVEWIDELFIRNTHTRATLDALWGRYSAHKSGFEFFGDAAGHQRRTSAGTLTDWALIANDERFKTAGRQLFVGRSNPMVADRFAACNAMFLNAAGERRMHIDPCCQHLIWDLENRAYSPGTNEPDDKPGTDVSHSSDAMGYTVARCWPIRLELDEFVPEVKMTGGRLRPSR